MKLEHTIVIHIKDKKPIKEKQNKTKCTQCEIQELKKDYIIKGDTK
jgi:hypothetical protein